MVLTCNWMWLRDRIGVVVIGIVIEVVIVVIFEVTVVIFVVVVVVATVVFRLHTITLGDTCVILVVWM